MTDPRPSSRSTSTASRRASGNTAGGPAAGSRATSLPAAGRGTGDSGAGDGVVVQRDEGLRQRAAVHRRVGLQGDPGLAEDDALEVGVGVDRDLTGDLPED